MCASNGDSTTPIDQLTFAFGNPTGRSLQSTPVIRDGSTLNLGAIGTVCSNQDPCRAQFESSTRVDGTACFIEGTPQSTSGQIRLYTKQVFRPVETYRIRLGTGTGASNTIEATIVRIPGAQNDRAAIYSVNATAQRSGTTYGLGADLTIYRPPANPNAERVLDVQATWFSADRRLIGLTRYILNDLTGHPFFRTHDSQSASASPSWTVVVRIREWLGYFEQVPFSCNNDRPYQGEPQCTSDELPPPGGPVLSDVVQEFAVARVN